MWKIIVYFLLISLISYLILKGSKKKKADVKAFEARRIPFDVRMSLHYQLFPFAI